MTCFVDTSALLAVMDKDDAIHKQAKAFWERLTGQQATLVTTNYVVLETVAPPATPNRGAGGTQIPRRHTAHSHDPRQSAHCPDFVMGGAGNAKPTLLIAMRGVSPSSGAVVAHSETPHRWAFPIEEVLEADLGKASICRRELFRCNRPGQLSFVLTCIPPAADQQQCPGRRHAACHGVQRRSPQVRWKHLQGVDLGHEVKPLTPA